MKALIFTVVFFGLLFLGYDYFMAPVGQKMVFKSLNAAPPATAPGGTKPASSQPAPIAKASESAPPPKEAPAPAAPSPSAPASSASAPAAPAHDADGFPLPKFESMDVLTKNWTFIPKSAFPRKVTLLRETEFKLSVGGSKVGAGGQAVALAMDNGMLTVAPTDTSPARAQLAVMDTDLPKILKEGYEPWKVARTAFLKQAWQRKKAAGAAPGVAIAGSVDSNGIPMKGPDGYPLLIASIRSGQVSDITVDKIIRWGEPQQKIIDGQSYWTVPVLYNANTIFGPMEVEAEARLKNGRVTGWFYTGSGEEVP